MANNCKYEKWKRYVSYDGGVTWDFLDDVKGELIEHDSPDCTIPEEQYRWVDSGYTCVDYDKYQQQIKQVSYDSGSTWSNVVPNEFSATTLLEHNSSYCGYVPPTPTNAKLTATYSDSTTYTVECNTSTTLTFHETRGHSSPFSSMTTAVIGDCVTRISNAFSGFTSLSSVTIPSGVTIISMQAFKNCTSLTSVTIPSGVTIIETETFQGCTSLTSIDIPNSVTSIRRQAFYGCSSLSSATIGSSVTSISEASFALCTSLTSVTIPSSVTSIGATAFTNCTSLVSITVEATTPPSLAYKPFQNTSCPIYVPAESVEAYKSASDWSSYASRIQPIT